MNVEYFIGDDKSIKTLIEISQRLDYSKLNASYKRLPKKEEATPKNVAICDTRIYEWHLFLTWLRIKIKI